MDKHKKPEKNLFREFNRAFEEFTKPLIKEYIGEVKEARALSYTIKSGRNRFRSGLPSLLLNDYSRGALVGAISEISWSAILILDDIGDKTRIRRGKKAVWLKFGLLEAVHAAALGFIISEELAVKNFSEHKEIKLTLHKAIKMTLKAQIEQNNFSFDKASTHSLLNNYLRKTALGRWPLEATTIIDDSLSEKEKREIVGFIKIMGIVGQIKNDLDDFGIYYDDNDYEPKMKDLEGETISYPIAVFFNDASEKDKKEFVDNYWGKAIGKRRAEKVMHVLNRYKVITKCEKKIKDEISKARFLIGESPTRYKSLLTEWVKSYVS